MKTINVPKREQVSPASQLLFDQIKGRLGKVPNLYATVGYSPKALEAFLNFDLVLNQGVLTEKEKEAIALTVSESNECNYCLAAHTLTSSMKGITKEETLSFRRGEAVDAKLNALVKLAKSIAVNGGKPEPELLSEFFNAGFNETALMELIGLVTARIFTNYVYAITDIPIDFPVAEALL
jgi:AhpD family alkylhydroperoxidase